MREHVAGLYIGRRYVTAAQVTGAAKDRLRVRHLGCAPLSAGENGALSHAVRTAMSDAGIKTCTVAASVRSESCLVKSFSYPYLDPRELQEALRLEAEESLMLPPEKICLDWHVNRSDAAGSGEASEGGIVDGVMVAAPRNDVEAELEALRQARLYAISMGAEILAIADAFIHAGGAGELSDRSLFLYVDGTRAQMCIFLGARAVYPRMVSFEAPVLERKGELMDHIQEDMRYAEHKLHIPGVRKFVVVDRGGGERALAHAVEESFGLSVARWLPWEHMDMSSSARNAAKDQPGAPFLPAVGLAVQGLR